MQTVLQSASTARWDTRLQGYLAHKKTHPIGTLPQAYA